MKWMIVCAAALSSASAFAQTYAPPANYQPPPGYKLVPIDQPPAENPPAPQNAPPPQAPPAPQTPPPSTYQQPVYPPSAPVYQPPASTAPPAYAPVYQYAPPVPVPVVMNRMSDYDIDQLTGQIALYPDPLVAVVLPASTYPLEVGAAAQWARVNPGAPEYIIQGQPWQPSIRSLVHYPSVLDMMAQRPDWTQRLGAAFLNQPADVTNSIQRLRLQAQAAGTLFTTAQQEVVNDAGTIRILPVDPRVIYVPTYDPTFVYVRREHPPGPVITFGSGLTIGTWLNYDVDWHSHWVVVGPRWDHHDVELRRDPWRRDVIVHTDDHHFDRDRHDGRH